MRLPFLHRSTPPSDEKPSDPVIAVAEGHDSIRLHVHNRTRTDFLAHSVFGALHTAPATQRVVSSSLPASPNPDSGGFSVRSTPLRLGAGGQVQVPPVRIQPQTAAATGGYTVSLTLSPRNTPAYTATLTAPAPTLPAEGKSGWKPLPLSSSASGGLGSKGEEVYALQSSDAATNTVHVLLLPKIDMAAWMATLPDGDLVSALCVPGTHESCALYGWPISACQDSAASIGYQLSRGVRFLDIRLALKGNPGAQALYAYHGVTDQKIEFSAILTQVYTFLSTSPRETVLMSVKQENNMAGFLDAVFGYINKNPAAWYLGTGIPRLGDVRGKVVLVSRFGSSNQQPGGIHPPIWPDSSPTAFSYTLPDGRTVVTQDWYNIGSLSAIPTKLGLITALLTQTGANTDVLGLNFTNGASFPMALPPWVAKGSGDQSAQTAGWMSTRGVNALLVDMLAGKLANPQGKRAGLMNIFALDFFDQPGLPADLATLIVQANFI
ncbi:PLC-like phosphodiesterase [Moesziomyces antarcticus]|uniref:PLC-like phosphodiesterase n=2 Tax=Pseudozyma antarctica TaxID=84753 RepID=A0A081CID4_PSEA2|nr:PLC-like phosphodiesterase [Moesziomyces antarcticus]GAK66430.1 PLC-like phosphodiesterase [Moesziomyces antarcticus]SPO47469.1 related to 1-phosphatidylinositol phosphodiesterase precursor [Moesziomyces antarcticus]